MTKSPALEQRRHDFGRRVRAVRNEQGMSQKAAAEAAGLHRTYWSGLKLGNGNGVSTTFFAGADRGGGRPGTTTDDASKIRQLEAEVRELKRANEILLAAWSVLVRELDPRLPW